MQRSKALHLGVDALYKKKDVASNPPPLLCAPRDCSAGSTFPDIPLLNFDSMNFTTLFELGCQNTQLAVLEFYVSHTRTAEPVIAIDP